MLNQLAQQFISKNNLNFYDEGINIGGGLNIDSR